MFIEITYWWKYYENNMKILLINSSNSVYVVDCKKYWINTWVFHIVFKIIVINYVLAKYQLIVLKYITVHFNY